MFISHASPSFGRDLDDNRNPAEKFTYRPDLWINSPQELWQLNFNWEEIAP